MSDIKAKATSIRGRPGGRDGEKVKGGGMGETDSVTAAQQAGVFSSTHLFAGITHLKRDGGGGGEGKLQAVIVAHDN